MTTGRPWPPDYLTGKIRKLCREAGVPEVTLHEAGRYTARSLMGDAGVPVEISMPEIGHADKSVHSHYNLIMDQAHLDAADQVAQMVDKAGAGS